MKHYSIFLPFCQPKFVLTLSLTEYIITVMDIQVKKLKKNTWEMHLIEPPSEYVFNNNFDLNKAREQIEEMHSHDRRVGLIHNELTASDFTMFSRQSYDRWHWYDKDEMNRFITYFTLKHGEK